MSVVDKKTDKTGFRRKITDHNPRAIAPIIYQKYFAFSGSGLSLSSKRVSALFRVRLSDWNVEIYTASDMAVHTKSAIFLT